MEELARFGATVHTCSRNQEELKSCLDDWKSNGLVVTGSVCDASDRDQREKLIQEVSSAFSGKLNILVSFSSYPTEQSLNQSIWLVLALWWFCLNSLVH